MRVNRSRKAICFSAMKIPNLHLLAVLLGCLAGLGGCATPETRIRKHPEIVASLAPEQLELIKAGRVEIGFNMDMVRLAVGEPDQVQIRAKTDGSNEVWSYATFETRAGRPLYRGLYHRYYLAGDPMHPFYLNYPLRRKHGHFRVVFKDDKVIAIEQDEPIAKLN